MDTLYDADADSWTKALAIGKFVASNIPHDNQDEWPKHVNAIGLWEYTKDVAPAFNCRLPELGKWAMIDTDMDGNYATDLDGTPLSLREIREHYIAGEKIQYHPEFKKASTKVNRYYAYMAKNTYWFNCWETLSYYQEDGKDRKREIGRSIYLAPSGFEGFDIEEGAIFTTDADTFWAAPVK